VGKVINAGPRYLAPDNRGAYGDPSARASSSPNAICDLAQNAAHSMAIHPAPSVQIAPIIDRTHNRAANDEGPLNLDLQSAALFGWRVRLRHKFGCRCQPSGTSRTCCLRLERGCDYHS
jgi:hypothetical protein